MTRRYFGTDGVRGVFGEDLTPELVERVARAATLWAGFTAARFITHDAFEGRPSALTTLNIAHELVTVVIMAIIIGVWPPAGTV